MRTASQQEHDAAEKTPFITELLQGGLRQDAYTAYLTRLRTIYAALEEAVRGQRNDPVIAAVYDPALERLDAIDADLECWANGSRVAADSSAAESYRRRLESLDSGVALLAHHYTRYLGDLSGGQAIGRTLDRIFNLGGVGLAFYAFPVQPKRYKDGYRARLDALTLQSEQVEILLSEVKCAFRLNQALLDELGTDFGVSGSRDR
ncbi:biliverdin-producing heme oxygenase [Candidatus Mycobacterium wuenschmannii]|uniref:Biliverdin-producing heme oxygenase n=1 Tax=Candidatus Mycobacterium wuenschmannii TaxID=3027808 RepID=A0ABY8W2H2_9MYCO|nr:biliverdin-producing heme oxygenase [Candidatus Mycobacterium wuenschmannii]WIM90088.1 biliverdin-producing heme oxygenase [Candidatus Mycobacterium wuenschmannii]